MKTQLCTSEQIVMGRFIDKLRSCCVCCRKKNYEKNEFNTYGDITSENGIENKEMVEI